MRCFLWKLYKFWAKTFATFFCQCLQINQYFSTNLMTLLQTFIHSLQCFSNRNLLFEVKMMISLAPRNLNEMKMKVEDNVVDLKKQESWRIITYFGAESLFMTSSWVPVRVGLEKKIFIIANETQVWTRRQKSTNQQNGFDRKDYCVVLPFWTLREFSNFLCTKFPITTTDNYLPSNIA